MEAGQVGREIRRIREAKGLSQTKAAAAADMGPSGLSQIETGARNPSAVTLNKIASALGVGVADLFPKGQASLPFDDVGEQRREPSLLDDPRIRGWFRESGLRLPTITEAEFRERVRGIVPGIDGDGNPTRIVEFVGGVMREQAEAHVFLWSPEKYRGLGPLLPVDPDAPAAEQKQQRREQLGRLRREVGRMYRRREVALINYANALSAEQEAMGKSPDYFGPTVGAAARRERMLEAAFAWQEAG